MSAVTQPGIPPRAHSTLVGEVTEASRPAHQPTHRSRGLSPVLGACVHRRQPERREIPFEMVRGTNGGFGYNAYFPPEAYIGRDEVLASLDDVVA